MVLGGTSNQVEQAMRSKPVSSMPSLPLLSSCLQVPAVPEFLLCHPWILDCDVKEQEKQTLSFLKLLMVVMFLITAVETLTQKLVPGVGCCCDRSNHALWRIVEELWNSGIGKPLNFPELKGVLREFRKEDCGEPCR